MLKIFTFVLNKSWLDGTNDKKGYFILVKSNNLANFKNLKD